VTEPDVDTDLDARNGQLRTHGEIEQRVRETGRATDAGAVGQGGRLRRGQDSGGAGHSGRAAGHGARPVRGQYGQRDGGYRPRGCWPAHHGTVSWLMTDCMAPGPTASGPE
jgi:hypothetical protein